MVDPACMAAIVQACDYITHKTAEWSVARIRQVIRDPQYQRLGEEVHRQASAGHLRGTKEACRAWWTYTLAYAGTPEKDMREAQMERAMA